MQLKQRISGPDIVDIHLKFWFLENFRDNLVQLSVMTPVQHMSWPELTVQKASALEQNCPGGNMHVKRLSKWTMIKPVGELSFKEQDLIGDDINQGIG